jgi:hypothetical protein
MLPWCFSLCTHILCWGQAEYVESGAPTSRGNGVASTVEGGMEPPRAIRPILDPEVEHAALEQACLNGQALQQRYLHGALEADAHGLGPICGKTQ